MNNLKTLLILSLLLFVSFAHGQYLQTSNPTIGITSCTSGYSTAYVTGLQQADTVYFSSNSANLQTSIYPQSTVADYSGSVSAQVSVTSPACFLGNVPVNIMATVCSNGMNCQTLSNSIDVIVSACQNSNYVCPNNENQISTSSNGFSNSYQPCTGSSCVYQSQYSNFANYVPSQFSATVLPITALPTSIISGTSSNVKFKVENSATEGNFQISLVSANTQWFSTNPTNIIADIPSGGYSVASFSINSNSQTPSGTYQFDAIVNHDGTQVADYPFFIQVSSSAITSIQIYLPSAQITVTVPECSGNSEINVPVQLVLQGAENQQSTTIVASDLNQQIYSNNILLAPQIPYDTRITLPLSSLNSQNNSITLSVTSLGVSETASFSVLLQNCLQQNQISINSVEYNFVNSNQIFENVQIENNGQTPQYNISANLIGIPANLNYTSSQIPVLQVGQIENVSLEINGANFAEQNVTLQILSASNPIVSQQLSIPAYSSQTGATGFFTLFSLSSLDSLLIIVLILALIPTILLINTAKNNSAVEKNVKTGKGNSGNDSKKQPPTNPTSSEKEQSSNHQSKIKEYDDNETHKYVERMRKLRGQIQQAVSNA